MSEMAMERQAGYEAVAERFRGSGRFAFNFARGKLKRDPVTLDLLSLQLLVRPDGAPLRLLDLGCGQGLLFAALASQVSIAPPVVEAFGIDAMPSNVRWGQAMLAARVAPRFAASIVQGDIRHCELPHCDLVVLIDVLHYLSPPEQEHLLERVDAQLAPGGRMLLRIGDAASIGRSRISRLVDRVVARLRGQPWQAVWQRPLSGWQELLRTRGFSARVVKVYRSRGTANVLMCCDRLN